MSSEVICPFYRNEDGVSLYCEGVTEENMTTLSLFSSRAAKERQKEKWCLTFQYGLCPIAAAVQKKYENDAEG